MKKIVFYDGDVKAFINGRKAVLLKFGPSELVLDGVLTKMFSKQDAKRGFEQIKRFISSASFLQTANNLRYNLISHTSLQVLLL